MNDLRPRHNVRVRDDVAVRIDHKSRTDRALPADHNACVSALRFFERSVAGHENLHDAWRYFANQRIDRFVQLAKRVVFRFALGLRSGAWHQ